MTNSNKPDNVKDNITPLRTKATVHDFTDYQHSKKVLKDFPKILETLYKTRQILEPYQAYSGVWDAVQVINNSIVLLELQEDYYSVVYEKRGKID